MCRVTRRGNGEGTVFRRNDGRWVGEVYVLQPNGGRVRKTVYGRTREEVADKTRSMLTQVAPGIPTGSTWAVEAYAQYWLENVAADGSLRPYVLPQVGKVKLPAHCPLPVFARCLLCSPVEDWRKAAGDWLTRCCGRSSRKRLARSSWNAILAPLVRLRQEHREEVKPWSPVEANLFLKAARGDRLYALFAVGVAMGLRRGELIGLKWEERRPRQVPAARATQPVPDFPGSASSPARRSPPDLAGHSPLPASRAEALRSHKVPTGRRATSTRVQVGRHRICLHLDHRRPTRSDTACPDLSSCDHEGRRASDQAARRATHLCLATAGPAGSAVDRHGDPRAFAAIDDDGLVQPCHTDGTQRGCECRAACPRMAPDDPRCCQYCCHCDPRSLAPIGHRRADLGFCWSRLSESNRRPSHYEGMTSLTLGVRAPPIPCARCGSTKVGGALGMRARLCKR